MVDVDGMVEGLSPRAFDEWLAYRQIVPDPMDRLIEVCKRGFVILANAWGAKVKPNELDPMEFEEPEGSAAQVKAILSGALGPGRHGNCDR